ncbi:HAD family hydrolase [Persephonella sp.]
MDRQDDQKVSRVHDQIEHIREKDIFLFDLDGTVIDSSKDIAVAVNYTLEKLGKDPLDESEIIKHVGYGGRKLMEGVLKTDDNLLIDRAVSIFREYYFKNPAEYTVLYPYVEDLFIELKKRNRKIGIVTNKYEDISKRIIEKLGIDSYLDILVGGDTVERKKPDPYPILYAVESLGSKLDSSVMIGDSEADVQAGRSAGTVTVFVTYGFGKKEKVVLHNPDIVLDSLYPILEVFKS